MLIGQSEKYHNILQNAVWVVLHVNLSFTVFFVVLHKLHGQCMQILRSSCTAHANRTEKKNCKSLVYIKYHPNKNVNNIMAFSTLAN